MGIEQALAAASAAVAVLLDAARGAESDEVVIGQLVELERLRRQLDAVDVVQLAELDRRGAAAARGYVSTAAMLTDVVRVSPGEAKARCARARDLGPRAELTGAPLPPIFPAVSAAQQAGDFGVEHVRVIVTAVEKIPGDVPAATVEQAEAFLVEQARRLNPRELTAVAARLLATIDPDGAKPREDERQRRSLSSSLCK